MKKPPYGGFFISALFCLMDEYINIGKIVASFGLEGQVILKHALGKKTNMGKVPVIFIEEQKGSYLPWFIKGSKAKTSDEMYLALEGIASKEAAKRLTTKKVWVRQADFETLVASSSPLSLIGYQVMEEKQLLGQVSEVIEQPHQVLLKIMIGEKEALIPLHDGTLDKIDRSKRIVHVVLPDGLLDIYL